MERDTELDAHMPAEWQLGRMVWLRSGAWARTAFPDFGRRREQVLAALAGQLGRGSELSRVVCGMVGNVVAGVPGAVGHRLFPVVERLAEIRAHRDDPQLQLVHCVLAVLDVHARFAADNPVLVGVREAGWSLVPAALVPWMVELALALRQWRELAMSRAGEHEPGLLLRVDTVALEDQIVALARLLAKRAGAPPWPLSWRTSPGTQVPTGAASLAPGPRYYCAILRVLVPDELACLPLYEAYADVCEPGERKYIEDAALALVRRGGGCEGDVLLRAALRAWMTGDGEGGAARAEAAFAAFPARSGDARVFAAVVAGLARRERDPLGARAWLLTASAANAGGDALFRACLAKQLALLCEQVGDALGARRAHEAFARIGSACMIDAKKWQRIGAKIDGVVRETPRRPEFDLEDVRGALADHAVEDAYEAFSERVSTLLAARTRTGAIAVLEEVGAEFEAELQPDAGASMVEAFARWIPATLTSWIHAALADLYDMEGDFDGWRRCKRRQLALEDGHRAAPEICRNDILHWYHLEERSGPTRRTLQCLEEAERALAAGEPHKVRFWTELAHHYRRFSP